jgi:hypothetical protein
MGILSNIPILVIYPFIIKGSFERGLFVPLIVGVSVVVCGNWDGKISPVSHCELYNPFRVTKTVLSQIIQTLNFKKEINLQPTPLKS